MTGRHVSGVVGAMAMLQFIAGAGTLPQLVGDTISQWIQLLVGALGAGFAVWMSGNVQTPKDQEK